MLTWSTQEKGRGGIRALRPKVRPRALETVAGCQSPGRLALPSGGWPPLTLVEILCLSASCEPYDHRRVARNTSRTTWIWTRRPLRRPSLSRSLPRLKFLSHGKIEDAPGSKTKNGRFRTAARTLVGPRSDDLDAGFLWLYGSGRRNPATGPAP